MKFTTLLVLVATASAIHMHGDEPKCVKKEGEDTCVLKGSSTQSACPPPAKKELAQKIKYIAAKDCKKQTGGFGSSACIMEGTIDFYCDCLSDIDPTNGQKKVNPTKAEKTPVKGGEAAEKIEEKK